MFKPSVLRTQRLFVETNKAQSPLGLICLVSSCPASLAASSSVEDDASCLVVLASSAWVLPLVASCLLDVMLMAYAALGIIHYTSLPKSPHQCTDRLFQITSLSFVSSGHQGTEMCDCLRYFNFAKADSKKYWFYSDIKAKERLPIRKENSHTIQ